MKILQFSGHELPLISQGGQLFWFMFRGVGLEGADHWGYTKGQDRGNRPTYRHATMKLAV